MSTKIICSLFLLGCATGLFAQQKTNAPASVLPKTIEAEPHWFTQAQLAQMNRKQHPRLKAIFSCMAASPGKKARDQSQSSHIREVCLANTDTGDHHLHHR